MCGSTRSATPFSVVPSGLGAFLTFTTDLRPLNSAAPLGLCWGGGPIGANLSSLNLEARADIPELWGSFRSADNSELVAISAFIETHPIFSLRGTFFLGTGSKHLQTHQLRRK